MNNYQTYLVGGAVRDEQLGLDIKEKDWLVVGATAQTLIKQGFEQVGKDFPVYLHPITKEEYALARTERKTGKGYSGFTTNSSKKVTLEEDLLRRDITINAIAQDNKGYLIDPYHGLEDLKNKNIKHISPAFSEDPVRILRVARFAAKLYHLDFSIDQQTLVLMKNMVKDGEVNELVAERVWQETQKALITDNPQVYFEILKAVGALKVLMPEVALLFGVPQPFKWHPEIDCGVHTMMVLQQTSLLSQNPITRFGALCHDLGKATTPLATLPSHKKHELRSVVQIKTLAARLKIPIKYKRFALKTAEFHSHCHKIRELKAKTILKVIISFDALKQTENFKQFTLACFADARGRTGHEYDNYPQAEMFLQVVNKLKTINFAKIAKSCQNKENIPKAIRDAQITAIKEVQALW